MKPTLFDTLLTACDQAAAAHQAAFALIERLPASVSGSADFATGWAELNRLRLAESEATAAYFTATKARRAAGGDFDEVAYAAQQRGIGQMQTQLT